MTDVIALVVIVLVVIDHYWHSRPDGFVTIYNPTLLQEHQDNFQWEMSSESFRCSAPIFRRVNGNFPLT